MPKRLKPTPDTKFAIDMRWWERRDDNFRLHLRDALCSECQQAYESVQDVGDADWVDPDTGEVTRQDALWYSLRTCCSLKPDYIGPDTPIIQSMFRTFLANGNQPLSPKELYERIDRRPPEVLLRILTKGQLRMGIRPALPPSDD